MPRRRVLLMGYYGAGNWGDELMLLCFRRWLGRQDLDITVLSEYPGNVERLSGLRAIANPALCAGFWRGAWFREKARRLWNELRKSEALVVGGGDLIRHDLGWPCLLFTLEKILLARALGRDVYLLNAGIGEARSRSASLLLNWCLRQCREIVVRDRRSLDICRRAGAFARLCPDIVLALPHWLPPPPPKLSAKAYILVCLRASANAFERYPLTGERLRNFAAALARLATAHNLEIRFLPFQNGADEDDGAAHERILEHLPAGLGHLSPWPLDAASLQSHFQAARMVVAMRLHAAVLAEAYGRPFALMPYDHKIEEFGALVPQAPLLRAGDLDDSAKAQRLLEEALAMRDREAEGGSNKARGAGVRDFWESFPLGEKSRVLP